jgi:uncharacterized surface protein with fasciclin (FAS1) repeats
MRMKNRLNKSSKHVAFAACMLALSGSFTACQDEYTLDEVKPSWLNSSIYETLESNGNYTNYLRLIADPDVNSGGGEEGSLVQILSRTGSKTVFAATDEAWQKFFEANKSLPESNPWHYAQSYAQLSKSQKKLLLHTSMLNNAIVMENLASSSGSKPTRGQYLRRKTDVELVDTVTRIAVKDLPRTYWDFDKQASETEAEFPEKDQWSRIRASYSEDDSIYMLTDHSVSMMIHFTNEYMAKKQITDRDFRIIMGRERRTSDVHVYDALLDSADIVCENGYVNMTEKPLIPLANMAEVIRTNGRTDIFSHLLDRFSVPYEDKSISKIFSQLNPNFNEETDTLYTKRYYSGRSFGGGALNSDERGNAFGGTSDAILKFDPGWNGYYPESSKPEEDMGAMFVPNDAQMLDYFNNGGGKILLEEYTKDHKAGSYSDTDLETLFMDIDQIPLNKLYAIINHCMFASFANSVPSKMLGLREEVTLEQIFSEKDTKLMSEGDGNIDTVLVACNGAVYIMNNVLTPSDFNCVTTPAYIRSTNRIMNWAIYSDYTLALAGKTPKIGLNYYAYLKAMQSRFTFFMPNDEAMQYYYDPMSFTSKQPRVMRFIYKKGNDDFPFVKLHSEKTPPSVKYDIATGKIGGKYAKNLDEGEIINRFRNMLEDFTIVHENGINLINTDEDEYYLSKNGMGIKVTREGSGENRKVVKAQGGFQLENEREQVPHINPGIQYCGVIESGDYKNGSTFTLDAPVIPAARSVFSVMSNIQRGQEGAETEYLSEEAMSTNPYLEFFKLCNGYIAEQDEDKDTPFGMEELIKKSGLVDESQYDINNAQQLNALNKAVEKFLTFYDNYAVDQNVTFFSNYNYTVYVPSNEAILNAIENGLPTWESIQEDFDNSIDESGVLKTGEDSLRIQAKITYLTNFIRSHFADKSFFADKSEKSTEMTTSSFNNKTGLFVKVFAKREKHGNETMLMVKDNTKDGEWINTLYTWEKNGIVKDVKNIMTCDRACSSTIKKQELSASKTTLSTSFAVVHLIDGILNHVDLENGKHSVTYETPSAARQYIQKFAIR